MTLKGKDKMKAIEITNQNRAVFTAVAISMGINDKTRYIQVTVQSYTVLYR